MTRLTFLAFGTRGDVQPAIALGKTLQARGYAVRLVASAPFAPWIERHGLEVTPSGVNIQALMQSDAGQRWAEKGTNPLIGLRLMRRLLDEHGDEMARDAWEGTRDADAVISSFTSDVFAASIAEKLDVPHISAPLQPTIRATRDGRALPNLPLPNRVTLFNYLFAKVMIEPFPWQLLGKVNNQLRTGVLGLPPQSRRENAAARQRMLVVHGFSQHVVPRAADWPENVHTAGYWFLDEEQGWTPPAALQAFLTAGSPPVYVGFGSMTGSDPAGLTRLLVAAIQASGQRAILQSGWAGIGDADLPDTIYRGERIPHDWLFPRMAAVVHHGGAGTTAEGLRAGVPTVIVPHMVDQPFWGARVQALGVGPAPIPRTRLTANGLAEAIQVAAGNVEMRARAAALGEKIRAEDGCARAAALIGGWIGGKARVSVATGDGPPGKAANKE